jgi:hypothetical protein
VPQINLTGKHEPDPTRPTRVPTFFWAHCLRRETLESGGSENWGVSRGTESVVGQVGEDKDAGFSLMRPMNVPVAEGLVLAWEHGDK